MAPTPPCPDARDLERLLTGDLPDAQAEHLEQHLLACASCVNLMRRLKGTDSFQQALQARTVHPALATGAEVGSLIDHLHRSPALTAAVDVQASALQTGPPDSGPPPAIYDALALPQGPGEIGRLGGYRILKVLGAGGMGMVFKAEDPQLQRPVALKVMKKELAADPEARQRFLREARAAAALNHDHIVSIHQVGEDNGVPFLVMPLLQGESLESWLQRKKPLPLAGILRIAREIAAGLAAAHEHGLIHRDIKPANIWLEARGQGSGVRSQPGKRQLLAPPRVKILDFGLVHRVEGNTQLTARGVPMGTPGYMAPEQAGGETVDPRCDLFSLGVVLYVLCTGVAPFPGSNVMAVLRAVLMDQPKPPREVNPAVPTALSDLVMQLLEKDPAKRPASAAAVVAALTAIEKGQQPRAVTRRRHFPWAAVLVLALFGAGSYFLGPTVYRIVTDQGELVIKTHDPDIQVSIKQNGNEVTLLDLQSRQEVTLRSGEYQLSLPDAKGVTLSTDRFRLTRGGKVTVEVQRLPVPAPPPASPPPTPAVAGAVRVFRGHTGAVAGVAFLSNGQRAVSGGYDGTIRLWDVATGKEIAQLRGHQKTVRSVAVTADGQYLLSGGGDHTVRLWGLPRRAELSRGHHADLVSSVAFAPDGQRFASGSLDQSVGLWRVAGGRGLGAFPGAIGPVASIAWSPDGKYLLCAGGDRLHLWNVDGGREEEYSPFRGHTGPVHGVAFAPDGKHAVSGGQDGTVRLWDVKTGRQLQSVEHAEPVQAVVFVDNRRVVAGGRDRKVYLWDVLAGRKLGERTGHTGGVRCVAVSPDGRCILSGADDQSIRLWSLPPAD